MRRGLKRSLSIFFRVLILLLIAATGLIAYAVFFAKVSPAFIADFVLFVRSDFVTRILLVAVLAVEVAIFALSFFSGAKKEPETEPEVVDGPVANEKSEFKHVGSSVSMSMSREEAVKSDFPYAENGIEPNFPGKLRFPLFRPLPTFKKLASDAVITNTDDEYLAGGWQPVNLEPAAESEPEKPARSSFGMEELLDKIKKDAEYSNVPPAAPEEAPEEDDVSIDSADFGEEDELPKKSQAARESQPSRESHEVQESDDGDGETFVADLDMVHGVGGLANHNGIVRRYNYKPPLPSLLKEYPTLSRTASDEEKAQGEGLVEFLKSFKIVCTLEDIIRGPAVIMYELRPALGVKSSTIASMAPDIARFFKVANVRVVTAMQGKSTVGIEVQSSTKETVGFKSMLSSILNKNTMKVPFVLGKDLLGTPVALDIYKAPHVLIAGSTGSGKSVCINNLIASILYTKTPSEVRMILVDPKQVELSMYSNIPHLLTPVITDSKRVIKMLDFCIVEMERRYKMISNMSVRNIEAYNDKIRQQGVKREYLPYIVVVLDEFGDIVTAVGKEFEIRVQRLAAKARAAGIHLVLATQRPSVDVITGTIKTNIPCRIAFRVASGTDSRTIIDSVGAESLLGYGDMLFKASTGEVRRVQGSFLSDPEVESLSEYCHRVGEPDFIDESYFEEDDDEPDADVADDPSHMSDDEYYATALKILYKDGEISTSFLQRKLNIGYNKAAKLIDRMDDEGLIGPGSGNKRRQLIKPAE